MATIAPLGKYQAFDDNGDPLSGGLLYTYEAGTDTPKATYTTAAGNVENENPVELDAAGYADVWLGDGGYKFVLKDADDATIFTVDNIGGSGDTAFGGTVNEIDSNTTITSVYANSVNICTNSPTLSLLPASTAGEGFYFSVKNDGVGTVTIDPDAGELIDGASTKTIGAGQSGLIICDGTQWFSLFLATVSAAGNNVFSGTNSFSGATTFTGNVLAPSDGTLTIASGAITVTGVYHLVDTEASAASDDLDTINGGTAGQYLELRTANSSRDVVVTNSGNITTPTGTSITLTSTAMTISLKYDGALSKWLVLASNTNQPPTKQYLTSGTGATYTTPVGCKSLFIQMVGGGGGGGAQNTNNGAAGTDTVFNSIVAESGLGGGAGGSGVGGLGGTGGAGAASLRVNGGAGSTGNHVGGMGGDSFFSGMTSAPATNGTAGVNAQANSGAGGSGAGTGSSTISVTTGGGGAGEYVELNIANPAASYTYTVGGGGNGGSAGTLAGGNGGSGLIIVTEFYQ